MAVGLRYASELQLSKKVRFVSIIRHNKSMQREGHFIRDKSTDHAKPHSIGYLR